MEAKRFYHFSEGRHGVRPGGGRPEPTLRATTAHTPGHHSPYSGPPHSTISSIKVILVYVLCFVYLLGISPVRKLVLCRPSYWAVQIWGLCSFPNGSKLCKVHSLSCWVWYRGRISSQSTDTLSAWGKSEVRELGKLPPASRTGCPIPLLRRFHRWSSKSTFKTKTNQQTKTPATIRFVHCHESSPSVVTAYSKSLVACWVSWALPIFAPLPTIPSVFPHHPGLANPGSSSWAKARRHFLHKAFFGTSLLLALLPLSCSSTWVMLLKQHYPNVLCISHPIHQGEISALLTFFWGVGGTI